jgi:hypothetical protein
MLIFASIFSLLIAYPMLGTGASVWVLATSQFLLLINEIRKGQVTGGGAFLFMSFLFFGVRPVYMLLEKDHRLLIHVFRMSPDWTVITAAMWWATLAVISFAVGLLLAPKVHNLVLRRRFAKRCVAQQFQSAGNYSLLLIGLQFMTLPAMYLLASRLGRSIRASALGAYGYELPMPLQAIHIFALVYLLNRYLKNRSPLSLSLLLVSGLALLACSWLMRDLSSFRGFYLTGIMVAGIACLQLWKGRVGYIWLITPIIALMPFFQYLGAIRAVDNEELVKEGIVDQVLADQTLAQAYWSFYNAGGDMNIFDTFVGAAQAEPRFYPYVWSWVYVPLHLVPRTFWEGKPKQGKTQDLAFARDAPYSPGIAGFFLMDGGKLWMVACMLLLGYLISCVDWFVRSMPFSVLQCCLIGITTINAMYLSRFFLWQYFYQVLYAVVPCILLAWFVGRGSRKTRASQRHSAGMRNFAADDVGIIKQSRLL